MTRARPSLESPTLEDILARAEALLPRLRERAADAERQRRVPDATIQDFLDAGLFRVLQPRRWGGYELDYGRTQVELCGVLGRACGSSAWVQCVVACHAWCLGMFPDAAQDAVWGGDPNTIIATSFSPLDGTGRPVEGGYLLDGTWQFSSGSDACDWIIVGTPIVEGDGPPTKRLWCLVPRTHWQVVEDTWLAAGLKGSGSNDVRIAQAFVPTEFTLDPDVLDGRPSPGSASNPGYIYRLPLWSFFPYNVSTPALGIARGALESYVDYMASRPDRANLVQRHLRISESAAEIDAAAALWLANAAQIERLGRTYGPWERLFLSKVRRDMAFATMLCVRAVDRLIVAVGAHGMLDDTPIQRAFRDVHGVANHGANGWDLQAIAFARESLGLPPLPMR